MTLRNAILAARKKKCKLKNKELGMYLQSAKNLLHWLFVATDGRPPSAIFNMYLNSNDWQLDIPEKLFHVYFVVNSVTKIASFSSKMARDVFVAKFMLRYGGRDDGDSNWIKFEVDGVIHSKDKQYA